MKEHETITIGGLFPEFSEKQRREAEQNLRQYLAALLRMAERLDSEGKSINDLAVDCSFDDGATGM